MAQVKSNKEDSGWQSPKTSRKSRYLINRGSGNWYSWKMSRLGNSQKVDCVKGQGRKVKGSWTGTRAVIMWSWLPGQGLRGGDVLAEIKHVGLETCKRTGLNVLAMKQPPPGRSAAVRSHDAVCCLNAKSGLLPRALRVTSP